MKLRLLTLACLAGFSCTALATTNGYYRAPAVHKDTVVFTAESDLWAVPLAGGKATRLTTALGEELHAAISADGRRVAYTGIEGQFGEVFVIGIDGGLPRQLTFEGGNPLVLGWTAAGEVLFSIQAERGPAKARQIVKLHPDSGVREVLPFTDANEVTFSADGQTLYFTRFGLHVTGDNVRKYRGGAMGQLWRYTLGDAEAVRLLPELAANLKQPMLSGDRLYFLSDESGLDNLWSMKVDGSDRKALTSFSDYAVRQPSLDAGHIVYQRGADLERFELASAKSEKLAIERVSDQEGARVRWLPEPLKFLTYGAVSGNGERLALTSRGQVLLAGPDGARRTAVSAPPGTRLRDALLSPDGQSVYAIADTSGEQEIWRLPADGSSGGEALTQNGSVHRMAFWLSGDGKSIVHLDKKGRLYWLDTASKTETLIDDNAASAGGRQEYLELSFAPDGQSIALVRADSAAGRRQILLIQRSGAKKLTLTSDRYESFSPAFSADGQWLYFLSERHFESSVPAPWGDRNTGPFFDKRVGIYGYALNPQASFPFEASKPEIKTPKPGAVPVPPTKSLGQGSWDLDGIGERLHQVPVAPGNYSSLSVAGDRLFVLDVSSAPNSVPALKSTALAPKPDLAVYAENVVSYGLAGNSGKLFYAQGDQDGPKNFFIAPVGAKAPDGPGAAVDLSDWRIKLDPRAEWRGMFADAWRMHRDYHFDRNLRGVDWQAERKRFEPFVERVGDRAELDDVLGQMIAAVDTLHSQTRGGEYRRQPNAPQQAALGGIFSKVADGYRVDYLYKGDAELPDARGPLQKAGIDVKVGDVISAVNGQSTAESPLGELLLNQAGKPTTLSVKRDGASRTFEVTPMSLPEQEQLRYGDWELSRRLAVEKASNGRFGYLHLRAMGPADIAQFVREFYANFNREGLVLDVRRNNGGNIDSWVIEKLLRRGWAFWAPDGTVPYWNMQQSFRGKLVVLADELTYSDGETFTGGIRALKLGKVIGQRTAGAGIWLGDANRLVDRGLARVAEYPQFAPDGRWIVEGSGVAPDEQVLNPPVATFKGGDAQLDAAIAALTAALAAEPMINGKPGPIAPAGTAADQPVK